MWLWNVNCNVLLNIRGRIVWKSWTIGIFKFRQPLTRTEVDIWILCLRVQTPLKPLFSVCAIPGSAAGNVYCSSVQIFTYLWWFTSWLPFWRLHLFLSFRLCSVNLFVSFVNEVMYSVHIFYFTLYFCCVIY